MVPVNWLRPIHGTLPPELQEIGPPALSIRSDCAAGNGPFTVPVNDRAPGEAVNPEVGFAGSTVRLTAIVFKLPIAGTPLRCAVIRMVPE